MRKRKNLKDKICIFKTDISDDFTKKKKKKSFLYSALVVNPCIQEH